MELAGKTFRAASNSANGALNFDTTMTFVLQDETCVLGRYSGGTIRAGCAQTELLAWLEAGLSMHLDGQWLTGDGTIGSSRWVLDGEKTSPAR